MDMTIDTKKFNTKEGQIISVDDVDDGVVQQYYLSEQKRNLKRMLWEAKHGDWVKEQERKAKDRDAYKKRTKQQEVIMSQVSALSASGMEPSEIAKV